MAKRKTYRIIKRLDGYYQVQRRFTFFNFHFWRGVVFKDSTYGFIHLEDAERYLAEKNKGYTPEVIKAIDFIK